MQICITRSSRYAYSETFIRDQIKEFSELAQVHSIHSGRFPEKDEDGNLLSPKVFWGIHKFVKLFTGRNNYFSNYGVKKYLQKKKIDVVLTNYGISAVHMVPVCKALNIPLLAIFHGHDATDRKLLQQYKNKYPRLFEYASYLIAVSEDIKTQLIKMGADPAKIEVVPCGVDSSKFKPQTSTSDKKNFISVGRFTPKKGPLHTIRAFYKVIQEEPNATLTMVGSKSGLCGKCEQLVAELGIEKSIHFTGVLGPDEISNLMSSSLGFIQHSITAPNGDTEGTPVSVMEASSSGLPIISTLHGGIKQAVVHGETGFLVEEQDEDAMAKYILQICKNPALAKEMGAKGRAHIQKNYEQKEQIRKLHRLAEKAIQRIN